MSASEEQLSAGQLDVLRRTLAPLLAPADPEAPFCVQRFATGYSNRSYLVEWGQQRWVVRAPPVGASPLTHDVRREVRALRAVAPRYPLAPAALHLVKDAEALGAPFAVLQWREGISFTSAASAGAARVLPAVEAFVDALAALHRLDADAAGVRDLGAPRGFVARQVRGWAERWRASQPAPGGDAERVFQWLERNLPPERPPAVLHNDYKPDNVLWSAERGTVSAVLDWELCALGDPLVDVGMLLASWPQQDDSDDRRSIALVPRAPGLPTRAQLVQRYAEASGAVLTDLRFYELLGLLKIAALMQQLQARPSAGGTAADRLPFQDAPRRVMAEAARLAAA